MNKRFFIIIAVIVGLGLSYSLLPNPLRTHAATTFQGDINGDGKVDIFDLSILLSNFGKTVSGTATPVATATATPVTTAIPQSSPLPSPGPAKMFDGMSNPNTSKTNPAPFAGFVGGKNGFARRVQIPGTDTPWHQLETTDNRILGDYYVNHFDNTLTSRAQYLTPATVNGKGIVGVGANRWVVWRFRHNLPLVASTSGTPSQYIAGESYATSGGVYGPPEQGSGPFAFRFQNVGSDLQMYLNHGMFAATVKRNTTYTMVMNMHGPSTKTSNDGYTDIWWSEGNSPVNRQTLTDPNSGAKSTRVNWQFFKPGVNDGGPNYYIISNYHRAYMNGWDGSHSTYFYGPFIYDAANVTDVKQIDPYYLLGEGK